VTNVCIGVGPARLQVPFPWARIKTLFTRRKPADLVAVLLKTSSLTIPRSDEGEIALYLWIVNFALRSLHAERLTVESWSWLSYMMPALAWIPRGLPGQLRKRSLTTLYVSCQLNAAAIRRIREASPPEASRLLGGGLALQLSGTLHLTGAKTAAHFQLEDQRPSISAYWLTAARPAQG